MRKKLIAGNWKMNGRITFVQQLVQTLLVLLPDDLQSHCLLLPPAIYLPFLSTYLSNSSITLGAQNVYPQAAGAFTGELSAPMLQDYSCSYVLVGHSERRHLFAESEKFVADKFHHVKEHDMIPLLCIGETLKEREQGLTEEILTQQILAITEKDRHCFKNAVIAYEPVWAIGTGKTASPDQVQEVHSFIRALVSSFSSDDANVLPIIYGGSVNENNAAALFSMPDVDGGLVGGASLNAQQFVDIVKCIN